MRNYRSSNDRRERLVSPIRRQLASLVAAFAAGAALAADPSFQISEVFSNADGMVQFVQLRETSGQNGQNLLAGKTLTATRGGRTKTFVIPADLPHAQTANRAVLLATAGYLDVPANFPEFKAVVPDYILPNQFLPAEGGTVEFAGVDTFTYPALPRDGFSAVYRAGNPIRDNSVQNYGGAVTSLPVVPVLAVEYYHATLDHYFISDLAPDIDALDSGRIAGWARTGKAFKVWPYYVDVPELQPFPGKVIHQSERLRVAQHPGHLRVHDGGLTESAPVGGAQQFRVRHAAPQKIGEPRGEFVVADRNRRATCQRRSIALNSV